MEHANAAAFAIAAHMKEQSRHRPQGQVIGMTPQRSEHIVVVGFDDNRRAHKALDVLRRLDNQKRVVLNNAAIVKRTEDGRVVPTETSFIDRLGTAPVKGGLIGAVVGLLGGPAGMVVGGTAGVLVGMGNEMRKSYKEESALKSIGRLITPGMTGLIAEVEEYSVETLDSDMRQIGATVQRWTRSEIEREIEAMNKAEGAAA